MPELRRYKTFSFRDQDPTVSEYLKIADRAGMSNSDVHKASGVGASTLHNWRSGKTKRPQVATMRAALRVAGFDFAIVPYKSNVLPLSRRSDVEAEPARRAASR